jgi:hypothetical protein
MERMAKRIMKLPSFIRHDYKRLEADLYYFLDEEDDSYNIAMLNVLYQPVMSFGHVTVGIFV